MLSPAVFWMIAAIAAGCAEMFVGTFYLLAIAAGGFVAAALAWADFSLAVQLAGFAAATFAGASGAALLRRRQGDEAQRIQHPDVGRLVMVERVDALGSAQVRYRGAVWRASAADGRALSPGRWRIAAVDGAELRLEPASADEDGAAASSSTSS